MSMMVTLQSPSVELTFDEDSGNGVLKSLDPVSQNTYGAFAPGPVEIRSASSQTKAGVTRINISIRVPLCSFDKDGNLLRGGTAAYAAAYPKGQNRPKFVQASLTVSIPNASGIIGSTANEAGVPTDQTSANLSATCMALQILMNLVGRQGQLPNGTAILQPDNQPDEEGGSFNPGNPISRGASGMIPVDPNRDRRLDAAE